MTDRTLFWCIAAYMLALALALRLQRLLFQRASRRSRQSETASHEAWEQAGLVSNEALELSDGYTVVPIPVDRIPDELDWRAANRLPAGLLREWGEDAKRRNLARARPKSARGAWLYAKPPSV